VDGASADDDLQKGDELGDRPTAELSEAAGVQGGERVREDVVRIRFWEPERTEGLTADFLGWPPERSPSFWVPAPTALDQLEEIRS